MSDHTMTDNEAGKPKHLSAADKALTFGVDTSEVSALADQYGSIVVTYGGSGYANAPAVTLNGAGGSGATATANLTNSTVNVVTITAPGNNYTTFTGTIAAPAAQTFDGATGVDPDTDQITVTSHPFVNNDIVTYSDGAGTTVVGLTDGADYYIITVDANNVKLALEADGAAVDITADGAGASHTLTGKTATIVGSASGGGGKVAHAGWVKKTVGTGGRAGRVQYETLVAASSMTSDANDDVEFPDA